MTGRCCKSCILRDIAGLSAASTIAQNHKLLRENAVASVYDLKPRFQALLRLLGDSRTGTTRALQTRFSELARQGGCAVWE